MDLKRFCFSFLILVALALVPPGLKAQDDEEESSPEAHEPEPELPVVLEKIVGPRHHDYCSPEKLHQQLSHQYRDSRIVQRPQAADCLLNEVCNPNYLIAYIGATFIKLDKQNRKFEIVSNGETCGDNCSGALAKKNKVAVIGPGHAYRESHELGFNEMYDSFDKDVKVSCPIDTCKGVLYYTNDGTMFFTETRNPTGKIERRLFVNGGKGAKFTDGPTDSIFPKCD